MVIAETSQRLKCESLIAGAYSSPGTVVVLRTKPVVNVAAVLSAEPGTINPDDRTCFDGQPNNCFRLRVCLGYSAEPADRPVYDSIPIVLMGWRLGVI